MNNNNSTEQTRLLSEILKWIKFAGIKEVKSILNDTLDTEVKRFIYQKSDGTSGTVELAKLVGFGSNRTVADMWEVWLKLGLGESIPVKGGSRFKRSFDLKDFGIEVPEIAKKTPEEATKQPTEQSKGSEK